MRIAVFMYHALSIDGSAAGADGYYSVEISNFREQVDYCIKNSIQILSIKDKILRKEKYKKCCIFTFDDGHVSNYEAAIILSENGFTADFFVNSANIDKENYLSRQQLSEMADMGMSIQSHSHDHVFMDDLSREDSINQLSVSKSIIQKIINNDVTIFAPPGGRYTRKTVNQLADLGYTYIANSKPGLWDVNCKSFLIPRLPMVYKMNVNDFVHYLTMNRSTELTLQAFYYFKKAIKYLLGNNRYVKFRKKMGY